MNKAEKLTWVKRSWKEIFERSLEVEETKGVGAVQPGESNIKDGDKWKS